MTSVLQEWVMKLPLRAQGTLLTGVRCCDVAPKNPICIDERYGCSTGEASSERQLHAFLRYCFLVPADVREVDVPGAWFKSTPPDNWKPSQFGHYPQHWYSHLLHSFEVCGYCHPEEKLRNDCFKVYERLCRNLHLPVETYDDFIERLTEDRIENGSIVS